MRPIKKLLMVVFALLLLGPLFGGSPVQAQAGTQIRVEPASVSAQVNETFDAFIKVDNVSGLAAFEVHFAFDPAVLEVVALSNGGFVAADFKVQETFDNSIGTIDYAIAQLNTAPATGSGTLLKITFRAIANGASTLALQAVPATPGGVLLADSNGAAIPFSWTGATVTVGSAQVPPTATAVATTDITATSTPVPGVTPTIEITPVTTPVVSPVGLLGTHKVRWGETLYCIGRGYHVDPWAIARENNIRWWPYLIFPGQVLKIPNSLWASVPAGPVCKTQFEATPVATVSPVPTVAPSATTPAPVTVTPTPTAQPLTCRAYHTVLAGETLYRIGVNYGVSYTEIARVNQLANPRLIYAGQRLCIP
jgi:LysM repeat protein